MQAKLTKVDIEDMYLLDEDVKIEYKIEQVRQELEDSGEDTSEYSDSYIKRLIEQGF